MSFVHKRRTMSVSTVWLMPARAYRSARSSTTPASVPSAAPKRISPECVYVMASPIKTASMPCATESTVRPQPKRSAIALSLRMPLHSDAIRVCGPTTASMVSSAAASPVVLMVTMTASAN